MLKARKEARQVVADPKVAVRADLEVPAVEVLEDRDGVVRVARAGTSCSSFRFWSRSMPTRTERSRSKRSTMPQLR